jgi:tight adherence protein B
VTALPAAPAPLGVAVTVAAVLVLAVVAAPVLTSPTRRPGPATARRARITWRRSARHRAPPGPSEHVVAAWCERVAGGVRSGSSLTQAIVDADEDAGSPFPEVLLGIHRGRPLATLLRSSPADPSTPAGLVMPVVASCAELGGPAAAALERVAGVLLARAAERDERATASAQARLSAQVLTILPVGVVGLLMLTEPSMRDVLGTAAGALCIAVGTLLDLVGWWWMRRMIGAAA